MQSSDDSALSGEAIVDLASFSCLGSDEFNARLVEFLFYLIVNAHQPGRTCTDHDHLRLCLKDLGKVPETQFMAFVAAP